MELSKCGTVVDFAARRTFPGESLQEGPLPEDPSRRVSLRGLLPEDSCRRESLPRNFFPLGLEAMATRDSRFVELGGSDAARLINWLTLGVLLIWVSIAGKALVFSCRTLHEGSSKWEYNTVDNFLRLANVRCCWFRGLGISVR